MEIAGRYTLDREVGRGGMGAVWLGTDQVLGRQVALKRLGGLAPGVGTPDFERAEREARLAARLNHPHVVAVFDLVDEGSEHWLVMEYVEGRTLAELVRQDGALTPDEAAPLLRQAADALAAAHESGIVHRDVKPSNILVTARGAGEALRLRHRPRRGGRLADPDRAWSPAPRPTSPPRWPPARWPRRPPTSGRSAPPPSTRCAGRPPYEVGDNVMGALYRIVHEDPPRLANAGWLGALLDNTMTKEPGRPLADGAGARLPRRRPARRTGARRPGRHPHPTVVRERPPPPLPRRPLGSRDGTQVLAPTPVTEPPPRAPTAGPGGAIIGVLAALVVVLLFLLFAWLFGAFDGQDRRRPTRSTPTSGSTSPGSEDDDLQRPADREARAEACRASSPTTWPRRSRTRRQSWEMLTPEFQEASGGFGQYKKYWDQWSSAVARQHRGRRRDADGELHDHLRPRGRRVPGPTTSPSSSWRTATADS